MRIALIGDFDTYIVRGLERPKELLPYRCAFGINLLRGLRELGGLEVHVVIVTPEVREPTIEDGPLGIVHRLPCPKLSGSSSLYLWRRQIIRSELRRIRPQVVHAQGLEQEYGFTAVTAPYPHVITIHGILRRIHRVMPQNLFSLAQVPRLLEGFTLRRAKHVICLSGEAESFLDECRSRAQRYRIPNAIAPCFFEQARQPQSEPTVLFVGTIYPLKGLHVLLEALPAVQRKLGKTIRLVVIGPVGHGPAAADYAYRLRVRAEQLGFAAPIDWRGVAGERDVAASMAKAHALVLPSFQETAPVCVGEAMAVGLPVVASRVGGIPDMVQDGTTGLLTMPDSVEELAGALHALLSNTSRQVAFSAASRAYAHGHYAPRVVAEQTLAVYRAIA